MSKIDYRRSHKGKKYDVRKHFVCEACKELFDVEEACHSVESGYGCFSCFEKIRERMGLEKSPLEKELENYGPDDIGLRAPCDSYWFGR